MPGLSPLLTNTQRLDWSLEPLDVLARFPADEPVALLHSGRLHPRWSRYSLLAKLGSAYRFAQGRSQWVGPAVRALRWTHRPFEDIAQLLVDPEALWVGQLSYDLGRYVEHLPSPPLADRNWPTVQLHHCRDYLVYDHAVQQWHAGGIWRKTPPALEALPSLEKGYDAGAPQPVMDRDRYEAMVKQVLTYIRAGDVFQVNLAQRFTAPFQGQPRALFAQLAKMSPAWFGAYLELTRHEGEPCRALASTSPELFLHIDADRTVTTRPIKGTVPAQVNPQVLRDSIKDQAELNMVVDMLRNDLGRVCAYGSMQVVEPRTIESHPTVHHGVATLTGKLHPTRSITDLLKATFPGGSITGAPKVRAMQIIDELEPVCRGPYCGAIGYLQGQTGQFNLAIRTLLTETHGKELSGQVDFSVGGGIVADSNPACEYDETLAKASALLAALGQPQPAS